MRAIGIPAALAILSLTAACSTPDPVVGMKQLQVAAPALISGEPKLHFTRLPAGPDMAAAYPDKAVRLGISGGATVNCAITAAGSFADCQIVEETPPGYQFGGAAIRIAGVYRFDTIVDGQSVVGRRKTQKITWKIRG